MDSGEIVLIECLGWPLAAKITEAACTARQKLALKNNKLDPLNRERCLCCVRNPEAEKNREAYRRRKKTLKQIKDAPAPRTAEHKALVAKGLCSVCGKRPRLVWPGGKVSSYCPECLRAKNARRALGKGQRRKGAVC